MREPSSMVNAAAAAGLEDVSVELWGVACVQEGEERRGKGVRCISETQ